MNGAGNKATVPLIIQVEDINDNIPHFEKSEYEFVLSNDLKSLTTNPAVVRVSNPVHSKLTITTWFHGMCVCIFVCFQFRPLLHFRHLGPAILSRRTKIRLFDTNVKSVLLYGSETWKVTETITRPLQTINHCSTHPGDLVV